MIIPFQFFLLLTNQHFRITADQSDKLPPLTHLIYLRGKSNNVSNTFCSFLLVLLLSLGPGGGTTILKSDNVRPAETDLLSENNDT